jgi:hypothetical protein
MTQTRWMLCGIDDWRVEDMCFHFMDFFEMMVDILSENDPIGERIVQEFSQ